MISEEELLNICRSEYKPSTKLELILLSNSNEPLSKNDFNALLNLNKTIQNYMCDLSEPISEGRINVYKQKCKHANYTCSHFVLEKRYKGS